MQTGGLTLSPPTRRAIRWVAVLAAVVGVALGVETLVLHLTTDPWADARVYYDAGARLNAGEPLYDASASDSIGLYLNPPLLAILFRPLALLPFPVAATIWEVVIVGAFILTLRRVGLSRPVLVALGLLALPILWAMSVGQAEPLVAMALAMGTPASIAFAGHLKLLPWLVAIYWVVRRDRRSLLWLAVWATLLAAFQLVIEPAATVEFLRLTWLNPAFDVRSVSPFAIHPLLWVVLVAILVMAAVRLGPTRHGWAAAVALAVLAYPRLLVYQLMSLLGAFGGPPEADGRQGRHV